MAAVAHRIVERQLPFFVYGTLMTGYKNNATVVRGRATSVRIASLVGAYKLMHFSREGFPGLYETKDAALPSAAAMPVRGELMEGPASEAEYAALLRDLDALEAYYPSELDKSRNMYERVIRHVSVDGNEGSVEAYVYLCNIDVASTRAAHVVHGDWRKYMTEMAMVDAGDDWRDILARVDGAPPPER
jgi:gamma-glutamylcyclotransferase (GGCT)/AIG2-like uncharacterized protein YtfP